MAWTPPEIPGEKSMTIDELISGLMRLAEASPHGCRTVVLLKFEGDVGIEGLSLGQSRLGCGRGVDAPVVLIQAGGACRPRPPRRIARRSDRSERGTDDPEHQDYEEAIRLRLCRAFARHLDMTADPTGGSARLLEQLLRVIGTGSVGLRRVNAEVGQLRLFDGPGEPDLARAQAICDATGATVVPSRSVAKYVYATDTIAMPSWSRYRDPLAYYTTRFHLTAHWAEKRLGWAGPDAEGKLVAVLASYRLAEAADISVEDIGEYREFHAAWLREIRTDPGFLQRVLDQAYRVADFILAFGENGVS